ncbi:hypothetical protein RJ639_022922, partial [Escallonia herrerae]
MVDGRSVMEQFNEIKSILDHYSQHKLALDEFIVVTSIIDKLPPSWKNFRNSLKHRKEDTNLDELGTHLRIEEDLRKEEKSKSEAQFEDYNWRNSNSEKSNIEALRSLTLQHTKIPKPSVALSFKVVKTRDRECTSLRDLQGVEEPIHPTLHETGQDVLNSSESREVRN